MHVTEIVNGAKFGDNFFYSSAMVCVFKTKYTFYVLLFYLSRLNILLIFVNKNHQTSYLPPHKFRTNTKSEVLLGTWVRSHLSYAKLILEEGCKTIMNNIS